MANLKELSKTEAIQKLQNARNRLKNFQKDTEKMTGRVVSGAMVVGGGAAVGVLRGLDAGSVPGTDGAIGWDAAIAAALGTVAVLDGAGKYSEQLGDFAFGMGAAAIAGPVEKAVRDMRGE